MKKLIVMIAIMAMTAAAFSQFTAGFKFRSRSAAFTTGSGTDADFQVNTLKSDFRFRPWFNYQINDMVSFKAQFEIGDAVFGNEAHGTDLGTDGKTVEVKHLYLNLKPCKDGNLRFGLMSYYTMHGLLFDDDFGGLKYDRNFGAFDLGLGFFVTDDEGALEELINEETYNFGENIITADLGFKINDKMSAGLNNMFVLKSTNGYEDEDGVWQNVDSLAYGTTSMFFAPHFTGDFGMVTAEMVLIYNMRTYSITGLYDDDPDAPESENGIALSLKTKIKATDKVLVGVDFVMNMGDDDMDDAIDNGFQAISSYYLNNLKIMDADTYNFWGSYSAYGIMMPSLYVNYMMNKKMTFGVVFGMAMTMNEVGTEEATDLGMEFGLNGNIKILEAVSLKPFANFFMPGLAFTGGMDADAATDMQYKIGMGLGVKF